MSGQISGRGNQSRVISFLIMILFLFVGIAAVPSARAELDIVVVGSTEINPGESVTLIATNVIRFSVPNIIPEETIWELVSLPPIGQNQTGISVTPGFNLQTDQIGVSTMPNTAPGIYVIRARNTPSGGDEQEKLIQIFVLAGTLSIVIEDFTIEDRELIFTDSEVEFGGQGILPLSQDTEIFRITFTSASSAQIIDSLTFQVQGVDAAAVEEIMLVPEPDEDLEFELTPTGRSLVTPSASVVGPFFANEVSIPFNHIIPESVTEVFWVAIRTNATLRRYNGGPQDELFNANTEGEFSIALIDYLTTARNVSVSLSERDGQPEEDDDVDVVAGGKDVVHAESTNLRHWFEIYDMQQFYGALPPQDASLEDSGAVLPLAPDLTPLFIARNEVFHLPNAVWPSDVRKRWDFPNQNPLAPPTLLEQVSTPFEPLLHTVIGYDTGTAVFRLDIAAGTATNPTWLRDLVILFDSIRGNGSGDDINFATGLDTYDPAEATMLAPLIRGYQEHWTGIVVYLDNGATPYVYDADDTPMILEKPNPPDFWVRGNQFGDNLIRRRLETGKNNRNVSDDMDLTGGIRTYFIVLRIDAGVNDSAAIVSDSPGGSAMQFGSPFRVSLGDIGFEHGEIVDEGQFAPAFTGNDPIPGQDLGSNAVLPGQFWSHEWYPGMWLNAHITKEPPLLIQPLVTIEANSFPSASIGLDLVYTQDPITKISNQLNLSKVRVDLTKGQIDHLAPLSNDMLSGVTLWKEIGNGSNYINNDDIGDVEFFNTLSDLVLDADGSSSPAANIRVDTAWPTGELVQFATTDHVAFEDADGSNTYTLGEAFFIDRNNDNDFSSEDTETILYNSQTLDGNNADEGFRQFGMDLGDGDGINAAMSNRLFYLDRVEAGGAANRYDDGIDWIIFDGDQDGIWDPPAEILVSLNPQSWAFDGSVFFTQLDSQEGQILPDDDSVFGDNPGTAETETGENAGSDYYICIRTHPLIPINTELELRVPGNGVVLDPQGQSANNAAIISNTMRANVPSSLTDHTQALAKNENSESIIGPQLDSNPPLAVLGINLSTNDPAENDVEIQNVVIEFYNHDNDFDFDIQEDLFAMDVREARVGNPGETTLSAAIQIFDTMIPVDDPTPLEDPNGAFRSFVRINNEIISYTDSNATNTLAGVIRGEYGTLPSTHPAGSTVTQVAALSGISLWQDHNQLVTSLTEDISESSVEIRGADFSAFPDPENDHRVFATLQFVNAQNQAIKEIISYKDRTDTTLFGIARGVDSIPRTFIAVDNVNIVAGRNGKFDPEIDQNITLDRPPYPVGAPGSPTQFQLDFVNNSLTLPVDNRGDTEGDELFIAIRTNPSIVHADNFSVGLVSWSAPGAAGPDPTRQVVETGPGVIQFVNPNSTAVPFPEAHQQLRTGILMVDAFPPPPITDLVSTAQDREIELVWETPDNNDLAGVLLVKSRDEAVRNPFDHMEVFENNFIDPVIGARGDDLMSAQASNEVTTLSGIDFEALGVLGASLGVPGHFLVIHNGPDAGRYEIASVSANVLQLTSNLTSDGSGLTFEIGDDLILSTKITNSFTETEENGGIVNRQLYTYRIFAFDIVPNFSEGTQISVFPSFDDQPPDSVSNVQSVVGDRIVRLHWNNPSNPDFESIIIIRGSENNLNQSPVNRVQLNIGDSLGDGNIVLAKVNRADTPNNEYLDLAVTNHEMFVYHLFAVDENLNYSSRVTVTATPTDDTIPPGIVSEFTAVRGNALVALNWENPVDTDFSSVLITRTPFLNSSTEIPENGATYIVGNLINAVSRVVFIGNDTSFVDTTVTNGVSYTYQIFAFDARPNYSQPVTVEPVTPAMDTEAPSSVSGLTASRDIDRIDLSWTNPDDPDFDGVLLLRQRNASPTGRPTDGLRFMVGALIEGAEVIALLAPDITTFSDTNVLSGERHFYTLFALDTSLNYADGTSINRIPTSGDQDPPEQITGLRITTGAAPDNSQAVVLAWDNPNDPDRIGHLIVRRQGSPVIGQPEPGQVFQVGEFLQAGEIIVGITNTLDLNFTDLNVEPGLRYFYAVFTFDAVRNYSNPVGGEVEIGLTAFILEDSTNTALPEAGDTIRIVFDRPIAPQAISAQVIGANVNNGFSRGSGSIVGTLAHLIEELGTLENPGNVSAVSSTMILSPDGQEITITLGQVTLGSNEVTEPFGFFTPNTSVQDTDGNPVAGEYIVTGTWSFDDADGDGMPDTFETMFGFNPNDPSDAGIDGDQDGLTNLEEFNQKTNPLEPDSDGDFLSDGDELNIFGTNPQSPDTDEDGFQDNVELTFNLPQVPSVEGITGRYSDPLSPMSPYIPRSMLLQGNAIQLPNPTRFAFVNIDSIPVQGPEVLINAPQNQAQIQERFVTISGTVQGPSAIVRIRIFRNEHLVDTVAGARSFSRRIIIGSGENNIAVEALDEDGLFGFGFVQVFGSFSPVDIRVTQTWQPQGDLDTWLVDPQFRHMGWTILGPQFPLSLGNVEGIPPQIPGAFLDIDDRSGTGPENVSLEQGNAIEGTYQVWMNNFNNANNPQSTVQVLVKEGTPDERFVEFGPMSISQTDLNGTIPEAWWNTTSVSWPSGVMSPPGRPVSGLEDGEALTFVENFSPGFTVELWVYPGSDDQSGVFMEYRNPGGSIGYQMGLDQNRPFFSILVSVPESRELLVLDPIPELEWSHIAFVFHNDSNEMRINVNGVSVGKAVNGISLLPGGVAHFDTTFDGLDGSTIGAGFNQSFIDEVRVWQIARTDSVIDALRFRQAVAPSTTLVAYYRFDDGGSTIQDFAVDDKGFDLPGGNIRIDALVDSSTIALPSTLWIDGNENSVFDVSDEVFQDRNGNSIHEPGEGIYDGNDGTFDSIGNVGVTDDHNDLVTRTQVAPLHGGPDDLDQDGMEDWYETRFFGTIANGDPNTDTDGDGLTNRFEFLASTQPLAKDTDGNGVFDGLEDSIDGDGVDNIQEQEFGSDPRLPDTDDDGVSDDVEIDTGTDPADSLDPIRSMALHTGGAGYVQAPHASDRFSLSSFTIEAWIFPEELTSMGILESSIIARKIGEDIQGLDWHNYQLGIRYNTDTGMIVPFLSVTPADRIRTDLNASIRIEPSPSHISLAPEKWTHLAGIYNEFNGDLGLYVNGVLVANTMVEQGIMTNGFGPVHLRVGEAFIGAIDEVRIRSAPASGAIIRSRMHQRPEQDDPGLTSHYSFDDGGNFVHDLLAEFERDWEEAWIHAGQFVGDAEVIPPPAFVPVEIAKVDKDGDGLLDAWEIRFFGSIDHTDGEVDSDNDGLNNQSEFLANTNPLLLDTDQDGVKDPDEDSDGDGVSNKDEQLARTHLGKDDTDDDGIGDQQEISSATSPIHSMSPPRNRSFRLDAADLPEEGVLIPQTSEDVTVIFENWTIEAWIWPGAIEQNGAIIRKMIGASVAFEIGLMQGQPYLRTDTPKQSDASILIIGEEIPVAKWTHLAGVWNQEEHRLSLYLNGNTILVRELEKEASLMELPVTGFGVVRMGGDIESGGFSNAFADEIRIWNTARSQDEIDGARVERVSGTLDGLWRYFRFDDGGNSIEDFVHPGFENEVNFALHADFNGDGSLDIGNADGDNEALDWVVLDPAQSLFGFDDEDQDGMADWFESFFQIDDPVADEDGDLLSNLYEFLSESDPTNGETGNADFIDDHDGDGLPNGEEQRFGTHPGRVDTDNDGLTDGEEVFGINDIAGLVTSKNPIRRPAPDRFASDPLLPLQAGEQMALEFDGAAAVVEIPDRAKYGADTWTIEAWVNPDSSNDGGVIVRRAIGFANGRRITNYELGLEQDGNVLRPYVRFVTEDGELVQVGGIVLPFNRLEIVPGNSTEGEWFHLAGAFDQSTNTLTLYLDGMPVAETRFDVEAYQSPVSANGLDASGEFVGAEIQIGLDFEGRIDEIRFWNIVRTRKQLFSRFRATPTNATGRIPSLVRMDNLTERGVLTIEEAVSRDHVVGELIVSFEPSVNEKQRREALSSLGVTEKNRCSLTGAHTLTLLDSSSLAETLEAFRNRGDVLYAEPNFIWQKFDFPDDPLFEEQWGLHNTGQTGGTEDADADAPEAWDITTGSKDIIVAVIDTGVDFEHPDLAANIWVNEDEIPENGIDDDGNGFIDDVHGYDFFDNDGDPMDADGHGTHVAGAIGALGNNRIGVSGVAQNVRIMALRFLGEFGGTTEAAIGAIDYAVQMGATLSNNSWGGGPFSQALEDAISRARDAGQLFVAAAGNESNNNDENPVYPASFDLENIISVAATDHNDQLADFSNFGATSVDIAAPGVDILSTVPNESYDLNSGTSMASPHVAGTAALILAANPLFDWLEVKNAILENTDPLENLAGKTFTSGRLNSFLSLGLEFNTSNLIAYFRGDDGNSDARIIQDLTEADDWSAGTRGRYAGALLGGSQFTENAATVPGDRDADGMPDWFESTMALNPVIDDGEGDADNDGLTNFFEFFAGTHPFDFVSNGSIADGNLDVDRDGFRNLMEQNFGSDPVNATADTDDDGLLDTIELTNAIPTSPSDPLSPFVCRSLQLPGNATSFLEIPSQPRFALEESWTVEADVRFESIQTEARILQRAIDVNGSLSFAGVNYELGIKSGGFPYVRFTSMTENQTGTLIPIEFEALATIKLPANIGVRVSGSFDLEAQTLGVYVNEQLWAETTTGGLPVASFVGKVKLIAGEGMLGEIDSIRIWQTSISNITLKPQLANGFDPSEDLVAFYTFDDGENADSPQGTQDFTAGFEEDWKTEWFHAAVLKGDSQIVESSCIPNLSFDADEDGIPDWWEKIFGLNPEDASDADGDLDQDNLTNRFEFLARTDPGLLDTDFDGIPDAQEDNDTSPKTPFILGLRLDAVMSSSSDYSPGNPVWIEGAAGIPNQFDEADTSVSGFPSAGQPGFAVENVWFHDGNGNREFEQGEPIWIDSGPHPGQLDPEDLEIVGDGLIAIDEQELGLHPGERDTDDDGIGDGAEVLSLASDPADGLDPEVRRVAVFYGNNEVIQVTDPRLSLNAFTLAVFMNPALVENPSNQIILEQRGRDDLLNYRLLLLSNQSVQFEYERAISGNRRTLTSSQTAPSGLWTLVLAEFDLDNDVFRLSLFEVDENDNFILHSRDQSNPIGQPSSDSGTLRIGSGDLKNDDALRSFIGQIDEVSIWQGLLDSSEISAVRNSAISTTPPPDKLVAYYPFDDGGFFAQNVVHSGGQSGNGELIGIDNEFTAAKDDLWLDTNRNLALEVGEEILIDQGVALVSGDFATGFVDGFVFRDVDADGLPSRADDIWLDDGNTPRGTPGVFDSANDTIILDAGGLSDGTQGVALENIVYRESSIIDFGSAQPSDSGSNISDFDKDGLEDEVEQRIIDFDEFDSFQSLDDVQPDGDFDFDGLTNLEEVFFDGKGDFDLNSDTDPVNFDSDNDTIADGWEKQFLLDPLRSNDSFDDNDSDGISNLNEYLGADGEIDRFTIDFSADPIVWGDSTHPGIADTDSDGLADLWEIQNRLDPNDSSDASSDPDADNLNNLLERDHQTDPNDPDSDDDSLADGWEVNTGLNPTDPFGIHGREGDPDNDDLTNKDEFALQSASFPNGTNPFNEDTDNDGLLDGWEFFSRNQQNTWLDPLNDSGIHGADGDPDNDGITNLEEQNLNSDPWINNFTGLQAQVPNSIPPDDTFLQAELTPERPHLASTLVCSPSGAFDPDGDAFEYRFQWYSNLPGSGVVDRTVKSGNELEAELTANGWSVIEDVRGMLFSPSAVFDNSLRDFICVIFAIDEFENESKQVASNIVTTSDAVPAPPHSDFTVSVVNENGVLLATLDNIEPDVRYSFAWFRNFGDRIGEVGFRGEEISPSSNRLNLQNPDITSQIGDVWYARVIGEKQVNGDPDSTIPGRAVFSNTVLGQAGVIGNGPPSAPIVTIEPSSPRAEIDDLECIASDAIDPDGDVIGFNIQWLTFDAQNNTNTPIQDSAGNPFTTPILFGPDVIDLIGIPIFCRVQAVDIFGNASEMASSPPVTIVPVDSSGNSGLADLFEPDNSPDTASRIAINGTAQSHSVSFDDQDWFTFTLRNPSTVIIATGSSETNINTLLNTNNNGGDLGVDTSLKLFREDDTVNSIFANGNVGAPDSSNFSFSAILGFPTALPLESGTYFVLVENENRRGQLINPPFDYTILIRTTTLAGEIVPTPDQPQIRPQTPSTSDDLIAEVEGVDEDLDLHYRWFVDDVQLPVIEGDPGDPAVTDSKFLPSIRTQIGQQWQVAVFAEDTEGNTSALSQRSDPVTITTLTSTEIGFSLSITAKKFFGDSGSLSQTITIGWESSATHGFDEGFDSEIPGDFIPPPGSGGSSVGRTPNSLNIPNGSFISEGLDNEKRLLTKDFRPVGQNTAWFLLLDMGDQPSRVEVEWDTIELPVLAPLQLVEVDPTSNFSPSLSTTRDMLRETSFEIPPSELSGMKVYRVEIGSTSATFTLRLLPGWNLISIPVKLEEPSPAKAFSLNSKSIFSGSLWRFGTTTEDQLVQSYFEVTEIKPGEGYWIFSNNQEEISIVLRGSRVPNTLPLLKNWNLVGTTTMVDAQIPETIRTQGIVGGESINDAVQYWDTATQNYLRPLDGEDCLKVLRGYWMLSPKRQTIELFPSFKPCIQ